MKTTRKGGWKASFWPVFYFKGTSSKTVLFWPVLFKIKGPKQRRFGPCSFKRTGTKRRHFGPKKLKKKLGLLSALCNLTPKKKKKKKEKEKKEVGDRGAPVDRVVPKRRLCEGASRRPEPRRAFHNYVYNFSLPIYKKKF